MKHSGDLKSNSSTARARDPGCAAPGTANHTAVPTNKRQQNGEHNTRPAAATDKGFAEAQPLNCGHAIGKLSHTYCMIHFDESFKVNLERELL